MKKKKWILNYLISGVMSDMNGSRLKKPKFAMERRPEEIWQQKIFCVLSSQFSAQRAASIANRIVKDIAFFDNSLPFSRIEEECFKFLSSPQIGYRFPSIRARQISLCWFLFWQVKDDYHEYIRSFDTEEEARGEIAKTFPGMGFKQSSMFLRNIGACKNLSVIDIHILYYLRACHNWEFDHLTPKRYLQAEDILRKDALHYGVELNVFDTIVWAATRALKRADAHV
jgi:N-glycosylase/DNA lyase